MILIACIFRSAEDIKMATYALCTSFYKVPKCLTMKPLKTYLTSSFPCPKVADQSSVKAEFCCKSYTLQSNLSTTFTLETEFAGRCV